MPPLRRKATPIEYTFLVSHHNLVHNLPFGFCKRDKRYNPILIISKRQKYLIVVFYLTIELGCGYLYYMHFFTTCQSQTAKYQKKSRDRFQSRFIWFFLSQITLISCYRYYHTQKHRFCQAFWIMVKGRRISPTTFLRSSNNVLKLFF